MIVYFADRTMSILGMASTDLPQGFLIRDDKRIEDIDSGVASLEFAISYTDETREQAKQMCAAGNYMLRYHKNKYEFYTIIETTHRNKTQVYEVYGEDAGLDLLNEVVDAYEAPAAHTIQWYIGQFTQDSGWEIGINEIPNLTRKLSWDSEQNVSERIRSVATQFNNAELGYSFEIEGLSIKHKYIDIYKQRGKSVGTTLRLGIDIDNITEKTTVANLVTELVATGGTPTNSDKPITLQGVSYDDGDIYVTQSGRLRSRKANELWSRYRSETGTGAGYLTALYSYDTTNQTTLLNHAITELKKMCQPETNYDIDLVNLPDNTEIGDTVNIVDEEDRLFLSARLLQLEESVTSKKLKGTFGDFLIKDAGIAAEVRALATQLSEIVKTGQYYTWFAYADDDQGTGISTDPTGKEYLGIATLQPYPEVDISDPSIFTWSQMSGGGGGGSDSITLTVTSSAGAVFKTTLVNTTLTAHVYKNGVELNSTAIAGLGTIKWYSISSGTETQLTPTSASPYITYSVSNQQALNVIAKLED